MKKLLALSTAIALVSFSAYAEDAGKINPAVPAPTAASKHAHGHGKRTHHDAARPADLNANAPENTADPVDPFEAQDPIRPFNEAIFGFNIVADEYVIHPVARGYHQLPDWMRYGASNFFTNLGEPLSAVNSLLQLDFQATGTTLFRFLLNSTFGLAGLRDFAGENGLVENDETFNQTLKIYGVDSGPYVVLPLLGPSCARDVVGRTGDWFGDPVGYYLDTWESVGQAAAEGIITRDEESAIIDQMYYESLDPYVATRAAYLQHGAVDTTTSITGGFH